jgi:hypothetical protein
MTDETQQQDETQGADDAAQKAIIEKETAGLKAKNAELLGKLKELQGSYAQASEHLKQWDGLDPEQVKDTMKRLQMSEEARLIADGKFEEVLKRKTDIVAAEWNSKYKAKEQAEAELRTNLESIQSKYASLRIDESVRAELTKLGALPAAIEDAVLRARMTFKLEGDDVLARDRDGDLLTGKQGALSIAEWSENMREAAPHWFGKPTGGGDRKQSNGNGASDRLKSSTVKDLAARIQQKYGIQ